MKRVFCLIIAVMVVVSLAGCGISNPPSTSATSTSGSRSGDTLPEENQRAAEAASAVPAEDQSSPGGDTAELTQGPGALGESEVIPAEARGIIVYEYKEIANSSFEYKIRTIDPDTGAVEQFATFDSRKNSEMMFFRTTHNRSNFSDDYTKIAVTAVMLKNNEQHAGWIEADGGFVDVTKALGLHPNGDFGDLVNCRALGFDEQYFYFSRDNVKYKTPVNGYSPSSVWKVEEPDTGKSTQEQIQENLWRTYYEETDQIDSTRFIMNDYDGNNLTGPKDSIIVDIETHEVTHYIPGSSRYNSQGFLSPNGSEIVFMSMPKNGGKMELYIVSLFGGDPWKVETGFIFQKTINFAQSGAPVVIDWK